MASRSWNRIELMGNLTRDPELRFTPSGTAVCTFGLATNRSYVVEGERKEEVDFHKIVAWGKLAELCNQLLKKGSRVFVSGRLQYRDWETQDGQKRRDAEVIVEDMIQLTPRNGFNSGEEVNLEDVSPAKASPKTASVPDDTVVPAGSTTDDVSVQPAKADEKVEEDLPF